MYEYNAIYKKEYIISQLNGIIYQLDNVIAGIESEGATIGGYNCTSALRRMVAHYRNVRNIVRNTYIAPPSPQELTNQYTAGGGGRSAGGGGNGSRGGGSIASRGGGTR